MLRSVRARMMRVGVSAALGVVLALAAQARADGPPEREPGPKATGKVFTAKAPNGLAYDFFLPKDYDAEKGITLTFILHGSNGWKGWGFSMHTAGKFRPQDFVVSPEGTTPNGRGGFNSLQSPKDLKRFHELHTHLKSLVKVNATYIYGLSQGSFFAHFYAGHHGDEVNGIVAHGSGLWMGSGLKKKNHHQAVSVMHGRGDPVYPYGGGVSAYTGYEETKYPIRTFRALEIDLHWAPWMHQAQQLAWCEGMTSNDAARVLHNFEWLEDVKKTDGWLRAPVAAYQVAVRTAEFEGVPPKAQARARKLAGAIEAVAAQHVAAIEASHAKTKGKLTASATWIPHARYVLRDWRGVPATDAFAKAWSKRVDKHAKAFKSGWKGYNGALEKGNKGKALSAALDIVEKAHLHYGSVDKTMLANMATWRDDAKKNGVPSAVSKRYDKVMKPFLAATKKGKKAYADLNKKM